MEAIDYLDWPPEKIVHCGIGIDERFQPLSLTPEAQRCLRSAVGLDRPFIMYTGGIDWRKNMEGLIEAFALLPPAQRAHYQLAIVCAVLEDERRALLAVARRFGLAARDVVLTGFVPDTDLIALYNLCELFVFPSFHEGFGLPVAEAMACGAAVIGANATSVPEVIGRPDALFDPTRPQAIAAAIAAVLNNEEFRQSLRRYGLVQARRYTWEKAAIHALTALEALPTSMAGRRAGPVSTEPRIQESTPATT
jgi:glycosyltransferase involved in cell wall biosynthesis